MSTTLLALASISCSSDREPEATFTVVAAGLEVPWSMAVAPDGRIFVAERSGNIRVISGDTLVGEPWATVPVYDGTVRNFEAGLMGLALHPDFTREPHVYVCFTVPNDTGPQLNRVGRLRETGGRGQTVQVLIDSIPAGRYHNGCRIMFGPDGKLYVSTGDAYVEGLAQNPSSLAGKILRIDPDGSIPADNPSSGSPVWALGLRNAQAMAFEPETGRLVLVEHGTGEVDEVNIIQRGGNYGWPIIRGIGADQRFIEPVFVFHAAPAGAAFLSGRAGLNGLVVATLNGQRLMRFGMDGDSVWIADDSLLSGFGRLRDVVESPDGSLLVATSNRDGRGVPARDDDRILRVRIGQGAVPRQR